MNGLSIALALLLLGTLWLALTACVKIERLQEALRAERDGRASDHAACFVLRGHDIAYALDTLADEYDDIVTVRGGLALDLMDRTANGTIPGDWLRYRAGLYRKAANGSEEAK